MANFFVSPGAGIEEGNYTKWTKKWVKDIPDGVGDYEDLTFHLDEKNGVLYLSWTNSVWPNKSRFGLFNLADFSVVFISPSDDYYQPVYFNVMYHVSYEFGNAYLGNGGVSKSIQSYVILAQWGTMHTIDVWRGGATPLWSRDIRLDTGSDTEGICTAMISPTGKYILIYENWYDKLILYEGS